MLYWRRRLLSLEGWSPHTFFHACCEDFLFFLLSKTTTTTRYQKSWQPRRRRKTFSPLKGVLQDLCISKSVIWIFPKLTQQFFLDIDATLALTLLAPTHDIEWHYSWTLRYETSHSGALENTLGVGVRPHVFNVILKILPCDILQILHSSTSCGPSNRSSKPFKVTTPLFHPFFVGDDTLSFIVLGY